MRIDEFRQQERGPRLFESWVWERRASTSLGELPLALHAPVDSAPTEAMVSVAAELVGFASANGDLLLDLLHGHYRYAEDEDWLSFWEVPAGLKRGQVLQEVKSVTLVVNEDLEATVAVNPRWDPEHKLALTIAGGTVTEVNGEPFELADGVLRPT